MTKSELIRSVLTILNEAAQRDNESQFLFGADQNKLERLIEQSYFAGWSYVADRCQLAWLSQQVLPGYMPETVVPETDVDHSTGSGIIELPSDYYRIGQLKLRGWLRAATETHPADSEVARHQMYYDYRGNGYRPVVIEESDDQKHWWRYYSCRPGGRHVIEVCTYIQMPQDLESMQPGDTVDVSARMTPALIYAIAGQVALLASEKEQAELILKDAELLIKEEK